MTGILGALAGSGGAAGAIRYSSRASNISEGATSNFASAVSGVTDGWNYGGSNTDAITITTTGATARLQGWTINNHVSGANSFTFRLAIISGSGTSGTILKQETITGRALSTLAQGSTMILFSDGGLDLVPGTYTLCFIWDASQAGARTYRYSGPTRSSSSITGASGTLGVSYSNASFGGSGALASSNGTTAGGSGQNVTLQWFF
jgi:hypothetical protein